MKYPHIQQHDIRDCGAACLAMISEFYGLKLTIAKCRNLIKVDTQGSNIYGIVDGSQKIGLEATALEADDFSELLEGIKTKEVQFPFIARIITDDMLSHFIVVYNIKKDKFIVGDPAKQHISQITLDDFSTMWLGEIITFKKSQNFHSANERKGILLKYFKYIINKKKSFALILVMSLIISFINISTSTIFKYILDDATNFSIEQTFGEPVETEQTLEEEPSDDIIEQLEYKLNRLLSFAFKNITTVSLSIIVLVILNGVLQLLRGYLSAITAKNIEIPMTLDYYNHLMDLSPSFFGTRKTGELMSRFSDTSNIREAISVTVVTVIMDSIMAVFVGIYLFNISYILFLISLATIALYALITWLFRKPLKDINRDVMESDARVESYLKESIDGIETIKSYQYEDIVKNKTKNLFTDMLNKNVKGSITSNLMNTLIETVTMIGTICLLWVGTELFFAGTITIGSLFVYNYMLSYFFEPISNLIELQPTMQTAIVASERLDDIYSVDTEYTTSEHSDTSENIDTPDLNGDIELNNIDFRYGNRELTLQNINMYIPKNKKTAIIGSSGCGKTTIAKLLLKFYSPENGTIKINNQNISQYSPNVVRMRMAYISQNVFFFSDTIKNNLKMGNNATDEEIENICKLCCVDDFVKDMPFAYDTMLEENASNLSTGQKQRLAIARALLKKPDILIMDEATGNLDVKTEDHIRRMIDEVTKNITCIIIAHRLNTIKNCDYIYVMDKGKISQKGTHEQLIQEDGIYANYWKI
ncbi:MAG: peptidase domain-containing ABC transporter [Acutalibacteraceae bacterium]|nr:peptidase domain-containing ABC transporter [Acutalibacteraceae bacterium]